MCINTEHITSINNLHDHIIHACIFSSSVNNPLSHKIWKTSGSPQQGIVANIRRSTRAKYYRVVKQLKRNQDSVCMSKDAHSLRSNKVTSIWKSIENFCSSSITPSNCVDEIRGNENITQLFKSKYENLFSSVPSSQKELKHTVPIVIVTVNILLVLMMSKML